MSGRSPMPSGCWPSTRRRTRIRPAEAWEPYRALYPELFAGERLAPAVQQLPRSLGRASPCSSTPASGLPGLWDWTAENEGDSAREPRPSRRLSRRDRHRLPDAPAHRPRRLEHGPRRRRVLPSRSLRRAPRRACLRRLAGRASTRPALHRCRSSTVSSTVTARRRSPPGSRRSRPPATIRGTWRFGSTPETHERSTWPTSPSTLPARGAGLGLRLRRRIPPECAETRRALLPQVVDRDVVVVCGHYPGSGIGRVVTRDGRVVWEEA